MLSLLSTAVIKGLSLRENRIVVIFQHTAGEYQNMVFFYHIKLIISVGNVC